MSTQPSEAMLYREALEALDFEQMRVEHEQFGKDCLYLSSVRPKLRQEHPDCWVAVYQERVAAVGPELESVFAELADRGIPKNIVALEFITQEPMRLIL